MTEGQELLLRKDMKRVVTRLREEQTHVEPYRDDYRRLLSNHGKMVRAAMVILFARACQPGQERIKDQVITGAAAIEMLHLATLVHDDVLDNAPIRRKEPTIHTTRGNKAAIYLGDLILSRYMEIMAEIAPNTAFIQEQAGTVCEIVGGELYQESGRHNTEITVEYYKKAISGKTAALFRLACLTGIRLTSPKVDPVMESTARSFGENLGMAFQIIDDINDFNLDKDTGKPKLEDIRDGIYTLPILLGFNQDQDLKTLVKKSPPMDIHAYLERHPGLIEQSKQTARNYLNQAAQSLEHSPVSAGIQSILNRLLKTLTLQV